MVGQYESKSHVMSTLEFDGTRALTYKPKAVCVMVGESKGHYKLVGTIKTKDWWLA
mgnify:CR=1 FL=1